MFVGLREKAVLFIISAMLIIGSVTLWLANSIQQRNQLARALHTAEQQVQLHKERTLAAIQLDLALSLKMADSDIVRRWVRTPRQFQQDPAARQELASFVSLFSTHLAFIGSAPAGQLYYFDQTGINAPNLKPTQTLSQSNPDDRWFFATLSQVEPYNFNIDHNVKLNVTKLWTNVVIKDKDQAIGVLGTGIDIDKFINEFIKTETPGLINLFINEDGVIQGHQQLAFIEQNAELEKKANPSSIWHMLKHDQERQQLKLALANAKAQGLTPFSVNTHQTITQFEMEGKPHVVAVAYLPPLKWYLVSAYDPSRLGNNSEFLPVVGAMLIGLFLVIVAVLVIGNHLIVAPLQHLAEAARRLAAGDLQVYLKPDRDDEIGQVTKAFNLMVEKVAHALHQTQTNLDTLHASEQRFISILDAVPDPILITRLADGLIVEINAEVTRHTLATPADIIGKTVEELGVWVYPEDRKRFVNLLRLQGKVRNFECETAMLGGHRHDLISATIIELDGAPHVLTISRDATERRQQEAALRRSHEMLARTQQIAGMGIWQWYPETDRMLWSKTMYEIYRLPLPAENPVEPGFVGSMSAAIPFGYVHPDDQARCMEEIRITLSQRQMAPTQFRILATNGAICTLHCEGEVMLDEQGRVNYIFGFSQDITERVNAEQAIRASEGKIAILFQTVPESLAISRFSDGTFIHLNEGFERATGWPQAQALGHTGLELGLWKDPDDRAKTTQILIEKGVFRDYECDFVRKDGTIWRGSACAAIADINGEKYVTQAVHDVTELRRQEAAARASEQKFYAIFNAIPDMIGVARLTDGIVVDFNDEAERACVLPREQIIGTSATSFNMWKNRADMQHFIKIITEQGMVREFEAEIQTPKGAQLHALLSGRLFELDNQTHAVLIAHDVTEIRRKELALHTSLEAQQAAETARQAAEAANQLKSEFLAMISHEVRTPLGGVIGMLRFALRAPELASDTQNKLQTGLSNAEALLQIINDILDYSKLEADKMQLDMLDFDLHGLVRDVVAILMERAETRGLHLVAEIESGLPVWWYGDPTRLRQVLVNLIGNAVKFTHQGEVKVKVGLDEDCQVIISVRDSGIGMSADTMQRLFQKFEQANAATARTYGGTGLGLAICKRIVEVMGGSINVASKLQVGTTFRVCLPLTPGVAQPKPTREASIRRHTWQLAILCAEDGATNQIIVRDLVERMGHTIDMVENGKLALAALAARDYDLVLMDSRMPEMDGIQALSLIRQGAQQVRDASIPVLALTANVSHSERSRFFEHGADGFLGKPINETEFQNEIERIMLHLIERGKPLRPQAQAKPPTTRPQPVAPTAPASAPASPPANYHPLMAFGPAARKNLIGMYLTEAPRLLQLAQAELAARNADALAMALHSLKGCSGYFDTGEFTQLCRTLEMAAKAENWAQLEQAFPDFEAAVNRVIENTRTLSFEQAGSLP